MSLYDKVSLGLYTAQSVVLILVLIVYAKQLTAMRQQVDAARHGSLGQNLLALANFLQAEDVREARRVVIRVLAGRPFTDWTDDEKRDAAKVCSSYGTAGIVLETGAVPPDPIIDNWGPSIRRCHKILEAFIRDMQKPENNGPGYWAVFDRLYSRAQRGPKSVA